MTKKTTSVKKQELLDKRERLNAAIAKLDREEKKQLRKDQNHHKFMIGGIIVKCFPDAYDFNELELNCIIACAFKSRDVQNMIMTVINDRPKEEMILNEEEEEDDEIGSSEYFENADS